MRSRAWEFVKRVGKEVDQQFWTRAGPHGAAELSAALFTGSAYVMYGQGGPAEQKQASEVANPPLVQEPAQERRRRSR